jgi:monothiol glutaredoxin
MHRARAAPGNRSGPQRRLPACPGNEHDIVVNANGIEVHFDPASAQRAKGIVIDWVTTVQGEGLSLKFPGANEIRSMSVHQLQQRLAAKGTSP